MTGCEFGESPDIELYFYGELDAASRASVEAHVRHCAECARRLDDLETIRRALASRPRVDAPPAGDWSGFMSRLNAATTGADGEGFRLKAEATNPDMNAFRVKVPILNSWLPPSGGRKTSLHRAAPWLALAATLVLVTIAAVLTLRSRTIPGATQPPAATEPAQPSAAGGDPLLALSGQHLERSKLVVLGLATRDPVHTSSADWEYERQLAGSLLSDTRLYRRAAEQRGLNDVARVMGDLETVLLETSLGDHTDPESLERVQQLIRKRDLVVKMQVIGGSGI